MNTKPLALRTAALAAASALALTACSSTKTEATADNPYALKAKGQLTICSDVPYAPFEFYDTSKNIVGFDVDMAAKIASDLKVEPNFIVTSFEEVQSGSALTAGKCDATISSLSINAERKTKMDFSESYYSDDLGVMVPQDSPVKSLADLNGLKVGVQTGSTGADLAKKHGISVVEYKDVGVMVQALQAGSIDAAIGNQSTLGYSAGADSGFVFHTEAGSGEDVGVAVKKGNAKLLEQIDKSLKEFKESGEMAKAKKKWFNVG